MTECIHGLEGTQCDICFPSAAPAPTRRPAPARAPRTPATRTTASRSEGPRTTTRPTAAALVPSEVRVYHVLPISAIADVRTTGTLLPGTDDVLLSDLGRELRATADVGDGRSVASFVAFSVSPLSTRWLQVRSGAAEPVWSETARSLAPSDYVMLVTTLGALGETIVTDGDAAGTWTRFARTPDEVRRVLERIHDAEDVRASAEALAPAPVPFEAITLIGVANEPAKDRVRALLGSGAAHPRVAVYPPWFAAE